MAKRIDDSHQPFKRKRKIGPDFTDEETVVEDRPREAVLKLVK